MELPGAGKQKYSFPVIVGMNPGEPLSTRAARMRIYNQLVRELDSDGAHYSQDLSEVDISDQDDVKVLTNDSAGAVLVHLGSSDFLSRYKEFALNPGRNITFSYRATAHRSSRSSSIPTCRGRPERRKSRPPPPGPRSPRV